MINPFDGRAFALKFFGILAVTDYIGEFEKNFNGK